MLTLTWVPFYREHESIEEANVLDRDRVSNALFRPVVFGFIMKITIRDRVKLDRGRQESSQKDHHQKSPAIYETTLKSSRIPLGLA